MIKYEVAIHVVCKSIVIACRKQIKLIKYVSNSADI